MPSKGKTNLYSAVGILKGFMLSLLALVIGIVSVSFASHHMRIGFEREYKDRLADKIKNMAILSAEVIHRDDLTANNQIAAQKYESVLHAMMKNSEDITAQNVKSYALYTYSNGALTVLYQSSPSGFQAMSIPVSQWLKPSGEPAFIQMNNQMTVLTPIKNSDGNITGLYELSFTYSFLNKFGNLIERSAITGSFMVLILALFLFALHYAIPTVIDIISSLRRKGG